MNITGADLGSSQPFTALLKWRKLNAARKENTTRAKYRHSDIFHNSPEESRQLNGNRSVFVEHLSRLPTAQSALTVHVDVHTPAARPSRITNSHSHTFVELWQSRQEQCGETHRRSRSTSEPQTPHQRPGNAVRFCGPSQPSWGGK